MLSHNSGKECSSILKCAQTVLQNYFFCVMLAFCFNMHFTDYKAITHNTLYVPVTVHREQSVERKKTNEMQHRDVYYQLLSQHVSGIIMPIFRRTKTMLLHMVYCFGSAGCGW